MPQTPNYGFDFETPTTLPGITITGGPGGASPILAEQVDSALDNVETQAQSNTADITAIETTLTGLEPVYARAVLSGTQSISTNNSTRIELNSVEYQSETLWDAGNFEFVIPAGRDGLYSLSASVAFDGNNTGRRSCDIETNLGRLVSSLNSASDAGDVRQVSATTHPFSAGDTIWVAGFQSSGGPLDVVGSSSNITHLAIARVGPLA